MKDVNLVIPVQDYGKEELVKQAVSRAAGIPVDEISGFQELRRSIDARNRSIKFNLSVRVFAKGEKPETHHPKFEPREFQDVSRAEHVVIVGAGPAGLFAALRLIELGKSQLFWSAAKTSEKEDVISRPSIRSTSSTQRATIVLEKVVQARIQTENFIRVPPNGET